MLNALAAYHAPEERKALDSDKTVHVILIELFLIVSKHKFVCMLQLSAQMNVQQLCLGVKTCARCCRMLVMTFTSNTD